MLQLDLFRTADECELIEMRREFTKVKDSADRCRKAQFSKIGELRKEVMDLRQRMEAIERGLCLSK